MQALSYDAIWKLFSFLFFYIICSVGKESACSAGDPGSILGLGRSSGEGNGNPLQYSCLENPMDRRAWKATVHRVARVGHDLKRLNHQPPVSYLIYSNTLRWIWFLISFPCVIPNS